MSKPPIQLAGPPPAAKHDRQKAVPDWEHTSGRLSRVALGLTGDAGEAEDLVQETMVRLLAQPRGHMEHEGYAVTTMTRLWLGRRRSLRRELARLVRRALTRPEYSAPADMPEQAETLAAAWQALEGLPPRQRAAFVLRVVENQPFDTIAAALGCDVGAVRSSLHVARHRLRQVLTEREEHTP